MSRRIAVVSILAIVAAGLVPAATAASASSDASSTAASPAQAVKLAPATDLATSASSAGIRLHWTDPAGAAYLGLVVRRAPGIVAPATPTSGTLVATLPPGTSNMVDSSVEAKATYTYAVFAMYPNGRHAAGAARHAKSGAAAIQPAADPGGGTFTGTVTDAAGHPLKGVEVSATVPPLPVTADGGGFSFTNFFAPSTARTDAAGHYTITHVDTASYLMCFLASTRPVSGGDNDVLGYQDLCQQDAVGGHLGQDTPLGTTALLDNTGGLVSGVVVDANTNAPIVGVEVYAETPLQESFVQTGARGGFRFGLPAGSYVLCFDASFATSATDATGYLSTCLDQELVTITAGQVTKITVPLTPGAVVTGVVRSAVDGTPIAGMDVEADSANSFADTTTADDGSYTLIGLAPSRTHICANGFFSSPTDAAPFGYDSGCVAVRPNVHKTVAAPDLSLEPAGQVSGRVVTASGHPSNDTTVFIQARRFGFSTVTGDDGTYSVPTVPAGKYFVCFQTPSYPVQCYLNKTPDERPTPVIVTSNEETSGIDATLPGRDPGSVVVTVQDSSGHPLVGADAVLVQNCPQTANSVCLPISVFPRPRNTVTASTATDGTGTAVFDGLKPGSYAACAFGRYATGGTSTTRYQDGCADSNYTVVVTSGGTTAVTVTLLDGAAVTGTVTDSHGLPLGGVGVTPSTGDSQDVEGSYGNPVVTAADGTYRIEGLPAGTTTICFDASTASGPSPTGYASECYRHALIHPTPITVTNGVVTTGIDAQLKTGAEITGTVTGIDDAPVGGVLVQIFSDSLGGGATQTDPDGTYRVAGLPPGTYQVCFYADFLPDGPPTGYVDQCYNNAAISPPMPVVLHAGQIASGIDAALQVGVEFTGVITSGGDPVSDAFFEIFQHTSSGSIGGGTDAFGGTYDLLGVPAGKWAVCADGTFAGYTAQCFNGVPWKGGGHVPPTGVTKISTTPGQVVTTDFDLTPTG